MANKNIGNYVLEKSCKKININKLLDRIEYKILSISIDTKYRKVGHIDKCSDIYSFSSFPNNVIGDQTT